MQLWIFLYISDNMLKCNSETRTYTNKSVFSEITSIDGNLSKFMWSTVFYTVQMHLCTVYIVRPNGFLRRTKERIKNEEKKLNGIYEKSLINTATFWAYYLADMIMNFHNIPLTVFCVFFQACSFSFFMEHVLWLFLHINIITNTYSDSFKSSLLGK